MIKEEFRDIAPFEDCDVQNKIAELVVDPGFEHAVRYVMPDVDYPAFVAGLKTITTTRDFQVNIIKPFVEMLGSKTTSGISASGMDKVIEGETFTFITNHRDIVLDAAFLNICFLREGKPTSEIAIGNNLLIYDWITKLVKLNLSFIVKRNLKVVQALEAAKQLSSYIHYALTEKGNSVWIAQREGRAKDSNDVTQESVVKMLSLGGDRTTLENIMAKRFMPVSISYEYDPNDYLKAREFLMKRRNPDFKKCQRDDLFSMETGLLGFKGRVHIELGNCINDQLESIDTNASRTEVVKQACSAIDKEIHRGYKIYPINYIAYDKINGTDRFANCYTAEEYDQVMAYLNQQLAKVDIEDLSDDDRGFMLDTMLQMYANPLTNKLKAIS